MSAGDFDRRRFFERFRLRVSSPDQLGDASRRLGIEHLPSRDPAVVRLLIVDWRSDVATSWEDGALVVYTQAGAMFRWELSTAELAFLRPINGQLSIGSLHDAVAVERIAPIDVFEDRIKLLTTLLEAKVVEVVRNGSARAGDD